MNPLSTQPRWRSAFAVALSGARATYINEFRRKASRLRDVLSDLGFSISLGTSKAAVTAGQAVTLLVLMVGLGWTPPPTGLIPLGIRLSAPELAAMAALVLAAGLLQARRRFRRAHRQWTTLTGALESGMRAGLAIPDIGLALMLVVQNLRWGYPINALGSVSLVGAAVTLLSSGRRRAWPSAIMATAAATATLVMLISQSNMLVASVNIKDQIMIDMAIAVASLILTASATPILFAGIAHKYALKTRGLFLDMGIKVGSVVLLASLSLSISEGTPWPGIAPFVSIAVFFLGMIFFRSGFVRTSSPETLGYALFVFRISPRKPRALIIRSLVTNAVLVLPALACLITTLLVHRNPQSALLLAALAIFEIAADALAIQRRTAVLPASRIAELSQRSRTGVGAALCAGMAVVLSGVMGGIIPGSAEPAWLPAVAGALVIVAALLIGVLVADATSWLRDLTATETEES
jgi:hypothetical protein